jgi:hypothetical protein
MGKLGEVVFVFHREPGSQGARVDLKSWDARELCIETLFPSTLAVMALGTPNYSPWCGGIANENKS